MDRAAEIPAAERSPSAAPDPSASRTEGALGSPVLPASPRTGAAALTPVIPPPEVAGRVVAAAAAAAPESALSLQDCTDWIADPAISLESPQKQECADILGAAINSCRELDCFAAPDDATSTSPALSDPAAATEPLTTTAALEVALTPEGGHPPPPAAGMVPRNEPYWDYPTCTTDPPWPSDCYPPSEWETPQDLSGCRLSPLPDEGVGGICASRRPDGLPHAETPRLTRDVVDFVEWCEASWHPLSCESVLFHMKWSLDYLGGHPWCVLQQYYNRIAGHDDLWNGASGSPADLRERHGWHICPTVVDPVVADGTGRRLSETGVSLAEQCRIVLPPDVRLEDIPRRTSHGTQRFGSDCDAWAEWVENRSYSRHWRVCDRSARLAEEWMEHHHGTPERYSKVYC